MIDLERQLADAVTEGRIDMEDADTVRDFAAFLRDISGVEAGTPDYARVLLEHADFLQATDEQKERLRKRAGEAAG